MEELKQKLIELTKRYVSGDLKPNENHDIKDKMDSIIEVLKLLKE